MGVKTERLNAYGYAASKALLRMMTRNLTGDLADRISPSTRSSPASFIQNGTGSPPPSRQALVVTTRTALFMNRPSQGLGYDLGGDPA